MDVYIKPMKKIAFSEYTTVLVKNVSQVSCDEAYKEKIKNLPLLEVEKGVKENYLINVLEIIEAIKKEFPDTVIHNVGESQTWVDYSPVRKKDSKFFIAIKVLFVSCILFVGSATTIMTFHAESSIVKIFENYHNIFFNGQAINPAVLNISYSLGLFFGIVVFFNHLGGKKITDDPTPIEVEISTYQNDVVDTVIDLLDSEGEEDADNS